MTEWLRQAKDNSDAALGLPWNRPEAGAFDADWYTLCMTPLAAAHQQVVVTGLGEADSVFGPVAQCEASSHPKHVGRRMEGGRINGRVYPRAMAGVVATATDRGGSIGCTKEKHDAGSGQQAGNVHRAGSLARVDEVLEESALHA